MSIVDPRLGLFCFGHGYVASALATAVALDGWRCAGTCRSETKCRNLSAMDIAAYLFDRDLPLANFAEVLSEFTHVLVSAPPDEIGDPVLDHHFDDLSEGGFNGLAICRRRVSTVTATETGSTRPRQFVRQASVKTVALRLTPGGWSSDKTLA